MPIPVVCASCQTRLNAPDAAAGKKVKCPKCQAVMAVPAGDEPPPLPPPPAAAGTPFDFGGGSPPPPPSRRSAAPPPPPEPEAPPAPAGGAAFDFGAAVSAGGGGKPPRGDRDERGERRRRRDEDDDAPPPDRGDRPRRRPRDDDDAAGDDDRPRGRPAKAGGGKFPWALVLGGLMVLLLLCCGGPTGVYFFVIAPKVKEAAKKLEDDLKKIGTDANKGAGGDGGKAQTGGSVPAGWVEARKDGVKAYYPNPPADGGLTFKTAAVQSAKSHVAMTADGELVCTLGVVRFTATSKESARARDLEAAAGLMSIIGKDTKAPPRTVTWLGGSAKETEMPVDLDDSTLVTRWVIVGNTGYIAQVRHKNRPDAVTAFFGNIEVPK